MTNTNLSLDGVHTVLFDLDGTLRHSRPSYNRVFFDLAAQFGVPGSAEHRNRSLRWAHYYWASSPELLEDIQTFEDNRDALLINFVRRYLIVYGCNPQRVASLAPQIHSRLSEEWQPEDWVDPTAPETLKTLKEAGLVLGVVSNRSQPFHDLLEKLELAPYFDFALAAGEVDSYKPDSAIFEHALQRAGACPACTIYVGDNYYADIVGAQRAGLRPVLLDPEGIFPDAKCPVIRSLRELQNGLV